MHAGTNITGVRLFDPRSPHVQEILSFWSEQQKDGDQEITEENLTVSLVEFSW